MVHVLNLRSFILEQERMLESKIKAAARGQLYGVVRPRASKKTVTNSGPQSYQAVLGRKFPPKSETGRTWPMRYEIIPHEPAYTRPQASQTAKFSTP